MKGGGKAVAVTAEGGLSAADPAVDVELSLDLLVLLFEVALKGGDQALNEVETGVIDRRAAQGAENLLELMGLLIQGHRHALALQMVVGGAVGQRPRGEPAARLGQFQRQ